VGIPPDDSLYGWRLDGSLLPGFPVQTAGDVYSSPALADIDNDGMKEIIFGSDDGNVYAIDTNGRPLPGWPQRTGHFVSASPTVADIDGDGVLEILLGSWDQNLYAWRSDGRPLRGWPVRLGHIIWSSATVADIDGDGRSEAVIGSDKLYVFRSDGVVQPGFPVITRSWIVSSPCVVDIDLDGHLEIGVGADRFYVFRANGMPVEGFPIDLGGYVWASPIAADIDGCGRAEWIVASWEGSVQVIRHDGTIMPEYAIHTKGPIYSSPAFFQDEGVFYLAVGSWDRSLYVLTGDARNRLLAPKPMFHGDHLRTGQTMTLRGKPLQARRPLQPEPEGEVEVGDISMLPGPPVSGELTYVDLAVDNPSLLRKAMILYDIDGERHPSPLVLHQGRLRGMIHPLRSGTDCSWHIELATWAGHVIRIPGEGEFQFRV
jgi:outer membrane protein assembly factor BamB